MHIYQYIKDLLPENPVFIEIGIHYGIDTQRIIPLCKGTPKYIAFEPDPRNFKVTEEKNLPITLMNVAIGEKEEKGTLYLSSGINPNNKLEMTGASSIRKPTELLKNKFKWFINGNFDETVPVSIRSLDKVLKELNTLNIDFIWCDAQGAEHDIIKGGQQSLKNTHYLYMEYSNNEIYEGQEKLEECLKALPNPESWKIIETWKTDILLENKNYGTRKQ